MLTFACEISTRQAWAEAPEVTISLCVVFDSLVILWKSSL